YHILHRLDRRDRLIRVNRQHLAANGVDEQERIALRPYRKHSGWWRGLDAGAIDSRLSVQGDASLAHVRHNTYDFHRLRIDADADVLADRVLTVWILWP